MKKRNAAIPASYVIFEKDGKILFGRRANTGYMDGFYQMPAGHVEERELPSVAIIREAKEEVGVDIDSADLTLAHVMWRQRYDMTGDRVDFFFIARSWKGEASNVEPDKCDDLVWVSPDNLPTNTVPHVRHALECIYSHKVFSSELSKDFFIQNGVYPLED